MNRRTLCHVLLLGALLGACPARAADGTVEVIAPWARATPPAASVGAAYLVLRNRGAAPDRLVGARTPAAAQVEIHHSSLDGGMMRMRQVEALALPPGAEVALAPGGHHLMLIGLGAPLEAGASFPMRLEFERAGAVEITVPVRSLLAGPEASHGQHPHH